MHRKKFLLFRISLGLLFSFLLAPFYTPPCFSQENRDPYKAVPLGKPLSTSPQFIVIDDFNTGKLKNQRGSLWQTKKPAIDALDISLDKQDARNLSRGYSLKVNFHLLPHEQAYFQSFLNRLDVSQAQSLIFRIKVVPEGSAAFSGRFEVTLEDWQHRKAKSDIDLRDAVTKGTWRRVVVPLTVFKGLDLDQLLDLRFEINSGDKKISGDLWIDEIAFFGFGDVAFESHRDNLVGYPSVVFDSKRRAELRGMRDKRMLKAIARDTWKYFENARDNKTDLVVDHLRTGDAPLAADYTSPTNIAMDLLSTIAAADLNFISKQQAANRIDSVLSTLEKLRRQKGFFFNFYDTKKLAVTRQYISTVDCGWIAIALAVTRQAFKHEDKIAERASRILDSFSFDELIDPENNQLIVGLDVPERGFGAYHYGLLVTEARATSFYAIGKGNLPADHWWYIYRTPPAVWKWQNQVPVGRQVTSPRGVTYFQGHYTSQGRKFVPSWGGSLFEFLMPTLVIDEKKLAPEGLGLNNRIATEIHRDYALKEKKYPLWGISPAATSDGRQWKYTEFGIRALGVKGYPDAGVVAPYVSFLALDSLPEDAIRNIRKFLDFETYGEYGFYDSWDIHQGKANPQYLALDQGMTLVAICNYLKKGSIQKRFQKDTVGKAAERAGLMKESFFRD